MLNFNVKPKIKLIIKRKTWGNLAMEVKIYLNLIKSFLSKSILNKGQIIIKQTGSINKWKKLTDAKNKSVLGLT